MSTFVVTYVIFWLALAIYVVHMGGRQRRILKRLSALQLRLQDSVHKNLECSDECV